MAAVAKLERRMSRERQAEGIALAKAAGRYDRGPKLTTEQVATARKKVDLGVPKAVVAREMGVSRSTLYAALSSTGRYSPFSVPDETVVVVLDRCEARTSSRKVMKKAPKEPKPMSVSTGTTAP